ncbi:MAG: YceI family protein [Flavobacteriales bacterium]|nr:YceI family protein [Flavobacteriales bacterium]
MKTALTFIALIIGFASIAQKVNTAESKVDFEISNMKINSVEGTFGGMTGTINFDPANLAAARMDVCIKSSSVNTDNTKRDGYLRKDDWFNVERHPEICIISENFEKSDNGYILKGKLTLLGVTKDISIPFIFTEGRFQGSFTINRLDYELGADTGTLMVGDEVEMTITCVLQ